ncbi:MAG TPA: polysaccharide biosynthesis/export family protein [Alphaproteobacteria bacterium]|nr:polysaccharide biosynthesis/export family protein [Alphaproteobacteria bacterium]
MPRALAILFLSLGLLCAVCTVGWAFAQEQKAVPKAGGVTDAQYRLNQGDKLNIVVFGQPDVSGEFQIDGAGNITMPLLGQVAAANRTVAQLQHEITAALDRDYIVDPHVSIEVLNFRPFYILGQVNAPGSYPYTAGMDVRQAVALAGGFTRRARTSTVTVIRETVEGPVEIKADPDAPILPGDTIEVERRLF